MPRFIPPHLMFLITLLIFVIWFMLLHYFRRNDVLQRFVAELFGDNTPDSALRNYELARRRLAEHLHDPALDSRLRQQIELALRMESDEHGDQSCGSSEDVSLSDRT